MAKSKIRIMRGSSQDISTNSNTKFPAGTPIHDTSNNYLYISKGNSLGNTKPLTTPNLSSKSYEIHEEQIGNTETLYIERKSDDIYDKENNGIYGSIKIRLQQKEDNSTGSADIAEIDKDGIDLFASGGVWKNDPSIDLRASENIHTGFSSVNNPTGPKVKVIDSDGISEVAHSSYLTSKGLFTDGNIYVGDPMVTANQYRGNLFAKNNIECGGQLKGYDGSTLDIPKFESNEATIAKANITNANIINDGWSSNNLSSITYNTERNITNASYITDSAGMTTTMKHNYLNGVSDFTTTVFNTYVNVYTSATYLGTEIPGKNYVSLDLIQPTNYASTGLFEITFSVEGLMNDSFIKFPGDGSSYYDKTVLKYTFGIGPGNTTGRVIRIPLTDDTKWSGKTGGGVGGLYLSPYYDNGLKGFYAQFVMMHDGEDMSTQSQYELRVYTINQLV